MEDYVIVDSVLQAMHMSKFNKKAKHLKKYDIDHRNDNQTVQNYSICYDKPSSADNQSRYSLKPNFSIAMPIRNLQKNSSVILEGNNEQNKLKLKYILDQNQKISQTQRSTNKSRECISQYFIKRQIQPKQSKQNSSRNANLVKAPSITQRYFYDANIDCISKKSRKCIIMPQKTKKQQLINNQFIHVDIRELIKQQWQQRKRQRKANCKTTACRARNGNQMLKQTKRIEQELRNKQNEQKYNKHSIFEKHHPVQKINFADNCMNKLTIPLTKKQIKCKASSIMNKYGIDGTKCCIKL